MCLNAGHMPVFHHLLIDERHMSSLDKFNDNPEEMNIVCCRHVLLINSIHLAKPCGMIDLSVTKLGSGLLAESADLSPESLQIWSNKLIYQSWILRHSATYINLSWRWFLSKKNLNKCVYLRGNTMCNCTISPKDTVRLKTDNIS